jgi:hypothetical protein
LEQAEPEEDLSLVQAHKVQVLPLQERVSLFLVQEVDMVELEVTQEEMVDLVGAEALRETQEELELLMKDMLGVQVHLIKVAETAVPAKLEIQMVLVKEEMV